MIEFTVCFHKRGVCFVGYMHLSRGLVSACRRGSDFYREIRMCMSGRWGRELFGITFYFFLAKTEAAFPRNKRKRVGHGCRKTCAGHQTLSLGAVPISNWGGWGRKELNRRARPTS